MKFYYATDSRESTLVNMVGSDMGLNLLTGLEEKKEFLLDLLNNECPLGDDFTNSNCPVRHVRKLMDERERKSFVDCLSEEEVNNIYSYHENCCCFFSYYLSDRNDHVVGVTSRKPFNRIPVSKMAPAEIIELR